MMKRLERPVCARFAYPQARRYPRAPQPIDTPLSCSDFASEIVVIRMAKFTKLNPGDVVVGRGRAALEARRPFIEALSAADAGKIELERGEKPATVKRLLQDAAKDSGMRIRSSWSDTRQQVLFWKKVGSR